MSASGINVKMNGQKVFVKNGRGSADAIAGEVAGSEHTRPSWNIEDNGFCLLTGQPMAIEPAVLDSCPVHFGKPHVFRVVGEPSSSEFCAEHVPCGEASTESSAFVPYYSEIAKAAKIVFPSAEYVLVQGHATFAGDVSQLAQVKSFLGMMVKDKWNSLLMKLPCTPSNIAGSAETKRERKLPAFGATNNFFHVDASASWACDKLTETISSAFGTGTQATLRTSPGKQRRLANVNFWRNVRPEACIKDHHLVVVNGQSVTKEEMDSTKFRNPVLPGRQEQHRLVKIETKHELVYFPDMVQSEILVFKQGEFVVRTADGGDRGLSVCPSPDQNKHGIFHSSIFDPTAPKDAVPRRSLACAGVLVIMAESEANID